MRVPSTAVGAMRAAVLTVLAFLPLGPADADDSLASLGAGGLQLLTSDDVVLERQDLVLSPERVTVGFTFRNQSQAPIESLVAFVLPDLSADDYRRRFLGTPIEHGDNFLSFEGSVDGQPIAPQLEVRAIAYDGTDITDRLVAAGASPSFFAIDDIPGIGERLRGVGVLDEDGIPAWTMRTRLYWRQAFPPSRPLRVEHRYRPLVGGMALFPPLLEESAGAHSLGREYCVSAAARATAADMAEAAEKRGESASLAFMDYTLTTGANWKGPIGDLSITIDAGGPDRLVATCFPGLRQAAPGRYEAKARGIEPGQDIHLMIIGP